MICRKTMQPCMTPGMCAPFQGCQPDQEWREIAPNHWHRPPVEAMPRTGWQCPVCGKGNAPFMPTCGNPTCGVDLTKGATA